MGEVPSCSHCGLPVPTSRQGGGETWFCCFGCRFIYELALPAAQRGEDESAAPPPSTLLLRLGLGIFLALNIMIASWMSYSREIFGRVADTSGSETALVGLANYLALFLCTIVIALLGLPLLSDAVRTLFSGDEPGKPHRGIGARINAQVLIVIGVFSAFALSVAHTLQGEGSLYFDTAAIVLVVVTLGSYLEAGARQRATISAHRLLAELPARVRLERGDGHGLKEVSIQRVRIGDRVQVRPGEMVSVDGCITQGTSRIDESSLTGESVKRVVEKGDRVLAGSQNHDGQLWVRAEEVADNTVLALMERSLREARTSRPPVQQLADRVASVFVPGVVLLAVGLFLLHAWRGSVATGLLVALSVLLISCPCALGLAAPLASWQGLRRAAERGILIDSAATLERAAAIRVLFFDKTGTLSRPETRLEQLAVAPGVDPSWALGTAASLESSSSHPIARVLVELAEERGVEESEVEEAANVGGFGIEGRLEGRRLRLGSLRWVEELGLKIEHLPMTAGNGEASAIYLMDTERVLARFELAEALRSGAQSAVESLRRQNIDAAILSGDDDRATQRLAERLRIPAEGGLLPTEKVERLRQTRGSKGPVSMVGDGVNDAPVLAAADVGIAMGSASELARRSGNVRLVTDQLDRVPLVFALAKDVRRRIRANLLFAFGFNSIGIVLAAVGLLTPVFAAVAMVISSLMVVKVSSRAGRVEGETRMMVQRVWVPEGKG